MANTTPELIPCPACTRHVRATETVCPHCGWTLAAPLRPQHGGSSSEPATMYGPPPVPDRARTDSHPIAVMYGPPAFARDSPRPVLSRPSVILLAGGVLLLLVVWWLTR